MKTIRYFLLCLTALFALPLATLTAETATRAIVTNWGGTGVSVIDPTTGRKVADIETGSKPHGVDIAPDGSAIYVSNEGDGTLSIIDPTTNRVTATVEVGDLPNQLLAAPDGRHVFVSLNTSGAVAVVDARARNLVKTIPVGRNPHILMLGSDGKQFYVTSEGDAKLVTVNIESLKVTGETPLYAWPRVLAQTRDGSRIYLTIRWLNGALVIDPAKHQVVDRIALGEPFFAPDGKDAHGIAVTPDGEELWIATQTTDDVTILSTRDHRRLAKVNVGDNPNWLEFSPDGKYAVVSNTSSNDATIIDVASRRAIHTVDVGKKPKRLVVGEVLIKPNKRCLNQNLTQHPPTAFLSARPFASGCGWPCSVSAARPGRSR